MKLSTDENGVDWYLGYRKNLSAADRGHWFAHDEAGNIRELTDAEAAEHDPPGVGSPPLSAK